MLNKNSLPSDIEYHIEQMEILLMDKNEKTTIDKIMQLSSLVEDNFVQSIVKSELSDDSWNYETKLLINYCKKKLMKSELIKEHIKYCYNFLIYKYIEDKLFKFSHIIVQREQLPKSDRWIFTCYSKNEDIDPIRWANTKFVKSVSQSDIGSLLLPCMNQQDQVTITTQWLQEHQEQLFNETIFEDINSHVQNKMQEAFKEEASINIVTPSQNDGNYEDDVFELFQH